MYLDIKSLPKSLEAVPLNRDLTPWDQSSATPPGFLLHWRANEINGLNLSPKPSWERDEDVGIASREPLITYARGVFLFTDLESKICSAFIARYLIYGQVFFAPETVTEETISDARFDRFRQRREDPRVLDLDRNWRDESAEGKGRDCLRPGDSFRWRGLTWEILITFPDLPEYMPAAYDNAVPEDLAVLVQFSDLKLGPVFEAQTLIPKDFLPLLQREALELAENAKIRSLVEEGRKKFEPVRAKVEAIWAEIGGQERALAKIRDIIETPIYFGAFRQAHNLGAPRGMLLYGPPGCGKTLTGKAIAKILEIVNGGVKSSESSFRYIKGSELFSKWHGTQEEGVRKIFAEARAHFQKHQQRAVLFFDEAESLFKKRSEAGDSYDYASTLIPAFLNELEDDSPNAPYVILATNWPENIDPAILRAGRMDEKIRIGRPDREAASAILRVHFSQKKFRSAPVDDLVSHVVKALFDGQLALYEVTIKTESGEETTEVLSLRDFLSGAMLTRIVQRTSEIRVRECIRDKDAPLGITLADCDKAVKDTYAEERTLSHRGDLEFFVLERGATLVRTKKARPKLDDPRSSE